MVLHEKPQNTHQPECSPDTRTLLDVLREQHALRVDHVPRFLALFEAPSSKGHISPQKSAVHPLVERLQRAGLLYVRHLRASHLDWIWLTRKGWQASGMTSAWTPPLRRKLPALHAVNELRLRFEEAAPHLLWITQQHLRQICSPRQWSLLPAAEMITGMGERIALYVVLRTTGTEEQLISRMRQQFECATSRGTSSCTALWYYALAPVAMRLRAAHARLAKDLGKEITNKIGIFTYPLIAGQMMYRAHHSPVRALAWSPDGKWIASANSHAVHVWEAATGNQRWHLTLTADPCHLEWSASGTWLALADIRGRLSLWKAADSAAPLILLDVLDSVTGLT